SDHDPFGDIGPVISAEHITGLVHAARGVHMAPGIKAYLVDLANATRRSPHLALGMSPRATLALGRVSRARAAATGRTYVIPDDIKALADPVLAHRMVPTPEAQFQGVGSSEALAQVLAAVAVPGGH
ncbi:MAG TPA: MoxR family ATPase, partial [Acidimicrobiales bacterium]|nr:MoxR family ATPase [Acidimicrobiales bacterium]